MSTIGTIKQIAASTAIAASLGMGGLGLASGIASAAPGDQVGSGASGNSKHQAPAPKTASGDDSEIHAHLTPGFIPEPIGPGAPAATMPQPTPATTPGLGNTLAQDDPATEERRNEELYEQIKAADSNDPAALARDEDENIQRELAIRARQFAEEDAEARRTAAARQKTEDEELRRCGVGCTEHIDE
jgi:hypothetical protein